MQQLQGPTETEPEAVSRRSEHDLRLAAGAGAAWLSAVTLAGRSPALVVLFGLAVLAAAIAFLLIGRRCRGSAVLALVGFCVAMVLLPAAGRRAQLAHSDLAQLAGARTAVTATLTLTGDPRPLTAHGVAGAPRAVIDAQLDSVSVAGRREAVSGPILILAPAAMWQRFLPGQQLQVDGQLQPPLGRDLIAAVLTVQTDPSAVGTPPWWQRAAGVVRASLRRSAAGLPDQVRGLLPGLVDGDTSGLDPVLAARFQVAGLTHLVAVSGSNCSILLGSLLLVLRRARARPWVCAVLGTLALIGFVVLARPSPSVLRAAAMASTAMLALAIGRPRSAMPVLSATVLALLVWQPGLATDAGFSLSVLATAALLLIAPGWASALRRRRVPPLLAESVAVAAAAHVVTAPVIAGLSGQLSVVAIPANMAAEPVVAVTTVLGFLAALAGPIWAPVGVGLAHLAGWPCRWLCWVAQYFGGLSGATVPWPAGPIGGVALLGVTGAVVLVARRRRGRCALAAGLITAVIIQLPVRSVVSQWPPPGWHLTVCDVGQGDALVLPAGRHQAIVIDTGPDPVAIDRCLSQLGIQRVPLLVLSHYHLDHVGGVVGVLHQRSVGAVITGPLGEPASGVELVRTALSGRGLRVGIAPIGASITIGPTRLDFLWPPRAAHGTRSDPNNSSLIIRATVDGVRLLLPGDAEIEEQQAAVQAGLDLRADVLKVPHHGSNWCCQVLGFRSDEAADGGLVCPAVQGHCEDWCRGRAAA